MSRAQLGNEFATVFCGVDRKCGRNDEEGGGESADGELLARTLL